MTKSNLSEAMSTAAEAGLVVQPSLASEPQPSLGTVAPPAYIPFSELTAALTKLAAQIGRSVAIHERLGARTLNP